MTFERPSHTQPDSLADTTAHPLHHPYSQGLDRGPAFYARTSKAVVALCGHETGNSDFHATVEMLNTDLKLGLSETDRRALSFMLTGLVNARRFGGEIHIDPVQGENSAAHSCHAVVLAQEIFRRSGLLAPERLTPEVDSLRRSIAIGCLIHDMGEILGELSSLAQRSVDRKLEELPDIEREIFRIALTEAYRAASTEPLDPTEFHSFVSEFRHAAQLSKRGIAGTSPENVVSVLQEYARALETRHVSPEVTASVAAALRLYDMAELKKSVSDPCDVFIGNAVKVVEHLQGLRHFMRFAKPLPGQQRMHLFSPETHIEGGAHTAAPTPPESVIPLGYISSCRFLGNMKYIEKELPHLFSSASTESERALAGAIRDAAYQCQVEWFSMTRPVIDRSVTEEIPEVADRQKKFAAGTAEGNDPANLQRIKELLEEKLREDLSRFSEFSPPVMQDGGEITTLLPIESNVRMQLLYVEALRVEFEPTSETPIVSLAGVPRGLRGFLLNSRVGEQRSASGPFDGLSMPPA